MFFETFKALLSQPSFYDVEFSISVHRAESNVKTLFCLCSRKCVGNRGHQNEHHKIMIIYNIIIQNII